MNSKQLDSEIKRKSYEQELLLCKKAGGDVEKYRRLSFDSLQLEQIRRGLESGVDVDAYLDPKKSWLEMEEIRISLETGFDRRPYIEQGYDWMQCNEIRAGVQAGLDVSIYSNKEYLAPQMKEIRKGLEKKLDVSLYASLRYDWFQMHEIRRGLQKKVNASLYADPAFKHTTMRAIRLGLQEHIDLLPYAKKGYTGKLLNEIRRGIRMNYDISQYLEEGYDAEQIEQINNAHEKGLNLLPYLRKGFHGVQLQEIIAGLKEGLDVSAYANTELNWFQMREIRYGLESKIDVSPYASKDFSPKQMEEIRKGILVGVDVSQYAKVYFDAEQMEEMRKKLEETSVELTEEMSVLLRNTMEKEAQASAGESSEEESEQGDGLSVEFVLDSCVVIAEDKMTASVNFSPVKDVMKDELEKLRVPDVVRLLKHHDVRQGISREDIRDLLEKKLFDKEVVVARGKEAEDGEDGKFKFYFRKELSHKPRVMEDGSVDYKSIELFEAVKKDMLLAEYESATLGAFGYDVMGQLIAPKRGKELPPLKGEGVVLSEDKKKYYSLMDGIIELDEDAQTMSVRNLYTVPGDVDASVGNIQFNGDVNVMGNVLPGFTITVSGSVVIDGHCEDCKIQAGKDVIIRKGCQGRGEGEILAGGNITGQFFESTTLMAKGDIEASYLLNCQVRTEGKLLVQGRKGVIIGGYVCAKQGVSCFGIGNIAEIKTTIEVGIDKEDMKSYQDLMKKLDKVEAELKTCETALNKFMEQPARDEKTTAFVERLTKAIYTQKLQKKEFLKEREVRMEKMTKQRGARIQVSGRVFSGTLLYMNADPFLVKDTYTNVDFVARDHKIDAVVR